MAGETQITVVGNVTADPELRFTQSGAAVANFTIASTPKKFDKQANDFKDGETLFLRCSAWREMAENVAESLSRGTRVVAQGNLVARSFQTKEGENRTVMELDVQEVGPSLRYASAAVTKNERGGGFGGQQGGYGQRYAGDLPSGATGYQQPGPQGGAWSPSPGPAPVQTDPWAGSQPQDEAPF